MCDESPFDMKCKEEDCIDNSENIRTLQQLLIKLSELQTIKIKTNLITSPHYTPSL